MQVQDFETKRTAWIDAISVKSTQRLPAQPVPSLIDAQFVPEVTHVASGSHLCMWTHCQVHDQPAAGVRVAWPNRQTLLPAERRLLGPWGRVTSVGKGTPVAQHPIGQQLLWQRQGEVGHRGRIEEKRQFSAMAGVMVAES